jgi:hypothetical protein
MKRLILVGFAACAFAVRVGNACPEAERDDYRRQ